MHILFLSNLHHITPSSLHCIYCFWYSIITYCFYYIYNHILAAMMDTVTHWLCILVKIVFVVTWSCKCARSKGEQIWNDAIQMQ